MEGSEVKGLRSMVQGPRRMAWGVAIFGITIKAALDCPCLQRDLDVVELWSGVGSIVAAAQTRGFAAKPSDKHRKSGVTDTANPLTTGDMVIEAGFRKGCVWS